MFKPVKVAVSTAATAAFALLATSAPSHAIVYNPFTQFSVSGTTLAPGNFTFGTYASGVITPFTAYQQACDANVNISCARNGGSLPVLHKNLTGVDMPFSTAIFPEDRLGMHPDTSQFVGLAFIAPFAGTYTLTGEFSIQDNFPTGVDTGARSVALEYLTSAVLNGVVLDTRAFSFDATLTAGEALAFYVGPAGNYTFDTTGLSLLVDDNVVVDPPVDSVPEPVTLGLLGAGLAGIGLARRRRT